MILTGPYTITITGDPDRFRTEALRRSGLAYLLERLFAGNEVAVEELESWGLKISLEDD